MSQHQTVTDLLGQEFWLPNKNNTFRAHEVVSLVDKTKLVLGKSYCICENDRDPRADSLSDQMFILNYQVECFFKLDGLVGNGICEYFFRCLKIGGMVSDRMCWEANLPRLFWPLTDEEVQRFRQASRLNLLKHHAKELDRLDRDLASKKWFGIYNYDPERPHRPPENPNFRC